MDILVSTKNIPGVHYTNIKEIIAQLNNKGTVVVSFDSSIDKTPQIIEFIKQFALNRTI